MTGPNKIEADKPEADRTGTDQIKADKIEPDKMESHYRQQLSALMDGALPADEARFLLRRLQHDGELAQCVDRWHVAGDVLRGEAQAILPAGFTERVAATIASEPALVPSTAVSRTSRWSSGLRWGSGAALAASVALVALFVARQPTNPGVAETPPSVASQVAEPSVAPSTAVADGPAAVATVETAVPAAIVTAASIATASVPRRNTIRRSTRSQSQRATIRTPARSERAMVAAATPQGDASSADDIFGNTAAAPSRPWPGAVLPQVPATGSFTVDYGSAASPSFYPFQPRLPDAQPASGEAPPVSDGASPP